MTLAGHPTGLLRLVLVPCAVAPERKQNKKLDEKSRVATGKDKKIFSLLANKKKKKR